MALRNANKTLFEFLEEHQLESFKNKLSKLGAEYIVDLEDVDFTTLTTDIGMTVIQANRTLRKRDEYLSKLVTIHDVDETIFRFLDETRLDSFKDKLKNQGVKYIDDLADADFSTLTSDIGMTVIQAKRTLRKRDEYLSKLIDVEYQLFTKLEPERKRKRIFNKDIITYCDLVNIICNEERNELGEDMTVELYTCEGYPLATRPISYISKLSDWCLEEYPDTPLLYAVPRLKCYTDKCTQYMTAAPLCDGTDHIFIRNTESGFKRTLGTNCKQATYFQLIKRIQDLTGIPGHLIQLYQTDVRINTKTDVTLNKLNLMDKSTIDMRLNRDLWVFGKDKNFCLKECIPTWYQEQSIYGSTFFFSYLYSLAEWMAESQQMHILGLTFQTLGHIRNKTHCAPLVHALNLMFRNEVLALPHRVAIQECLFLLFQMLITNIELTLRGLKINMKEVTENTDYFWIYLIQNSTSDHMQTERYFTFNLTCSETLRRMTDPVLVNDVHGEGHIVDRSILDKNISFNGNFVKTLFNYKRMIKSFLGDEAIVWNPVVVPIDKNHSPNVQQTLELSNCFKPSIVPTSNGNVGVYLGNSNNLKMPHVYYDVQTGHCIQFNAQEIGNIQRNPNFRDQNLAHFIDQNQVNPINPRDLIILNTNKSSGFSYLNKQGSLMSEIYRTLLNLTTAHDLKYIVGLTLIAKQGWVQNELSGNSQQFDPPSILSNANPNIINTAIEFAVQQLKNFITQYSEYRDYPCRILCLSDEEENNSNDDTTSVTRLLIDNNIIMDCVLLCNKVGDMHTIAEASGGFSFMSTDAEEWLVSIFEQETMSSMKGTQYCWITLFPVEFIDLTSQHILRIDTVPSYILPEKLKIKLQTAEKCLTRAFIQKQLSSHTNTDLTKRILQELSYYQAHPHPAIEVFPGEEHIDFWRIIMEGPEGTPYEGGIFELFIEFINEYPAKPPNIRFITPIYHCNINSIGHIYHPILDKFYTPGLKVGEILIQFYELLINPQPEDYLNSVKTNLFCSYKAEYVQKVKSHTNSYTTTIRNKEKVLNSLLGCKQNVYLSFPEHLVCPLTMELFQDPVTTLFKNIYERKAIEDHLRSGKKYDPLTFRELDEDGLRPNIAIKSLAKNYMAIKKGATLSEFLENLCLSEFENKLKSQWIENIDDLNQVNYELLTAPPFGIKMSPDEAKCLIKKIKEKFPKEIATKPTFSQNSKGLHNSFLHATTIQQSDSEPNALYGEPVPKSDSGQAECCIEPEKIDDDDDDDDDYDYASIPELQLDCSQPTEEKNGMTAKALYGYEACESDEMSIPEDAIITEIEQIDAGWWIGECNGARGLFPANYVELI